MTFDDSADEVWRRASSVQDIPKYWRGTRSLEIVSVQGDVTKVKVTFGFGGSGEAVITKDEREKTLTIEYTAGPFAGRQVIAVRDRTVVAKWDVKFKGALRLVAKGSEGHFRSGTVHALERLAGKDPGS